MDPLQILFLQATGALLAAVLFATGVVLLLLRLLKVVAGRAAVHRELRARRRYAACRARQRNCRLGKQHTQLINLAAEQTQLFSHLEQEMRPVSQFYVFDDFPINRTRRTR